MGREKGEKRDATGKQTTIWLKNEYNKYINILLKCFSECPIPTLGICDDFECHRHNSAFRAITELVLIFCRVYIFDTWRIFVVVECLII